MSEEANNAVAIAIHKKLGHDKRPVHPNHDVDKDHPCLSCEVVAVEAITAFLRHVVEHAGLDDWIFVADPHDVPPDDVQ